MQCANKGDVREIYVQGMKEYAEMAASSIFRGKDSEFSRTETNFQDQLLNQIKAGVVIDLGGGAMQVI